MFAACSNDATQDLSVSDVFTIPREQELHTMDCCQGDVRSLILKLRRALNPTPGELLSDFTAASMKRLRFD